jgi:hypothetical protein
MESRRISYFQNFLLFLNQHGWINSCENGVWRIKYNDELYGLYKDLHIVIVIKVARLRRLGHLEKTSRSLKALGKGKTQIKVA